MITPRHIEELERTGTVAFRDDSMLVTGLHASAAVLQIALSRLQASANRQRCPDCSHESRGLCADCAARRQELEAA